MDEAESRDLKGLWVPLNPSFLFPAKAVKTAEQWGGDQRLSKDFSTLGDPQRMYKKTWIWVKVEKTQSEAQSDSINYII